MEKIHGARICPKNTKRVENRCIASIKSKVWKKPKRGPYEGRQDIWTNAKGTYISIEEPFPNKYTIVMFEEYSPEDTGRELAKASSYGEAVQKTKKLIRSFE